VLEQIKLFRRVVGRCPSRTRPHTMAYGVTYAGARKTCVWVALPERTMVSGDTEQPRKTLGAYCTLRGCPSFP